MRPQARIALAIGAIILAGLVAYVLMPRQPKVTEPEPTAPVLPEPGSTSLPTSGPTTQEMTDAFSGMPATATAPAEALTTRESLSSDRWDDAFHNGQLRGVTPATPSDTLARSATPRTYTVQSGDSFYTISQKVYGNTRQVDAIRKANPSVNPSRLRVGQVLKMPEATAPAIPATPAHVTTPERTAPDSTLGAARTYKVQPGDNLRKISARFYGNTGMWQKIYDLNRSVIGSRPDALRVGMVLRLPEGASTAR